MNRVLAAVLALTYLSGASHATTYDIVRSFDGATVVGTIETDGTIGAISRSNVVSWKLRLTSPTPLAGVAGTTDDVSSDSALNVFLRGIYASQDTLTMAGARGSIVLQGGSGNGWCMSFVDGCVGNGASSTEYLFFDDDTAGPAASQSIGQSVVFATRAIEVITPVPLPATLPLLLVGLGGAGLLVRRRSRKTARV